MKANWVQFLKPTVTTLLLHSVQGLEMPLTIYLHDRVLICSAQWSPTMSRHGRTSTSPSNFQDPGLGETSNIASSFPKIVEGWVNFQTCYPCYFWVSCLVALRFPPTQTQERKIPLRSAGNPSETKNGGDGPRAHQLYKWRSNQQL